MTYSETDDGDQPDDTGPASPIVRALADWSQKMSFGSSRSLVGRTILSLCSGDADDTTGRLFYYQQHTLRAERPQLTSYADSPVSSTTQSSINLP